MSENIAKIFRVRDVRVCMCFSVYGPMLSERNKIMNEFVANAIKL